MVPSLWYGDDQFESEGIILDYSGHQIYVKFCFGFLANNRLRNTISVQLTL